MLSTDTVEQSTMRAAVWLGPGQVAVRDVAVPDALDGCSRVRVEYIGICGTDLTILAGKHPRAAASLVVGHEIVGVVDQESAGGPPRGTRVAIEPLISCETCWACRHGAGHVCRNLKLYGIDEPGGCAEHIVVPTDRLVPIAEDVPALRAAWTEPLAVAVHAVASVDLSHRETVLVYGAGPIGILVALVARRSGAGRVVLAEPNPTRRKVAEDLGFETVPEGTDPAAWFRATNDAEGADVAFDTAGHPGVAAALATAVHEIGTIVVVAVYKEPVPVDLQAICFGERRVIGVRVYTRRDFVEAVDLLSGDKLGLDKLPTMVFALDQAPEAFAAAASSRPPMKVFLRGGGS